MAFTWGENEFGTSGFGGIEIQIFSVTGVEATGATGSATTRTTNVFPVTGVAGTAAVGDEVAVAEANVSLTGLQLGAALGDDGTIADAVVNLTGVEASTGVSAGWGEGAWGEPYYGGGISFVIGQVINVERGSLQAVEATASVGDETIVATANVALTGVSSTAGLGAEVVIAKSDVPVTGVSATADLGASDEEVIADAVVIETGLAATGAIGSNTVVADANVLPTGVSSTAALGDNADDEATGGALIQATGVSAQAIIAPRTQITIINTAVVIPTGVVGTTNSPRVTMWGGSDDLPPTYNPDFWTTVAA